MTLQSDKHGGESVQELPISALHSKPMRVLLIEDDAEAAAFLVKALKEAGHISDHAADGETGL